MRPLSILVAASACYAAGGITVVFDADAPVPEAVLRQMRSEIERAFAPAGISIDVRDRKRESAISAGGSLVYLKLRGECRAQRPPVFLDERGPLAWTETVEGSAQPFGQIACGRVRRAVDGAIRGVKLPEQERLWGRALGRVAAHEVIHMLGGHKKHSREGLFQRALNGEQLIADSLPTDPHTLLGIEP